MGLLFADKMKIRLLFLCWILSLVHGTADVPSFTTFNFLSEPQDSTALKGSTLRLDCKVVYSKSDIPLVEWFKDGARVNTQDHRYNFLSNGSIIISAITDRKIMTDAGEYYCSATVKGQTIVSRTATVVIGGIERNFRIEPVDLEVYLTDTAMFQCQITSVPPANITWYKDDDLVADKPRKYRTYPEGVLEIYNVQFQDFGNYYCKAEGVDRLRQSRTAKLVQKKAIIEQGFAGINPNFTLRPLDTMVTVGSNRVILFCGAYGLGSDMNPPTIEWLKDGKTIDLEKDGRVTIIGGGNLQILSVKAEMGSNQESDEAIYMCRAQNDVDSADAEAKLTVIVPPTLKEEPQHVHSSEKSDATMRCSVEGIPEPTVKWFKNGVQIIENDYFLLVDNAYLRILGVLPSDAGYYQCFAENSGGNIQSTVQLMITSPAQLVASKSSTPSIFYHVQRSGAYAATNPNDVPSQPKNLSAILVSTRYVTLSWAKPDRVGPSKIMSYTVEWQEKGSERERMTNTSSQEVNIQRLKPNTEYTIKVYAFNRYGGSISPVILRIRTEEEDDVPSAPRSLSVVALSPKSIQLSWQPPAQPKGAIKQYSVKYYTVGMDEQMVPLGGSILTHTVTGLEEFTEYIFRIIALNENGEGQSTDEVRGRTFSDVPSDVPQNFTLETTSSTSIVVRWRPPLPEHQNGQITGYKIRYKKKGVKKGSTATTAGDRDGYALTDLKKDTVYQVRIMAQTVNGSGPATDWQNCKTYEDDLDESRVPDIPEKLVVRPMTNSLVVQWFPNQRSKILVRGYYLGYGKGIPDVFRVLFDANTFFYTIDNLQPASEYVVSIRAFNDKGEGQPRYENMFTLVETEEEPITPMLPPIGLKAIVLSSSTIVLTWTDNSLGKIQRITDNRYYTIKYNSVPGNKKYVNSTDLVKHIEDLKPDTMYEFSVKVTKGRRKSRYSMTVSNTTQEAAPGSMPRDLTPVPVEGDPLSVTLNWQPPQKPNGQITGYLVFYTTDPNKGDLDWVVEGVIGEKLSMTITDLTQNTQYYFKVQARNSKGYGPLSDMVTYKTPLKENIRIPTMPGVDNPQRKTNSGAESTEKGLSQNVMIIIIACVVGATFCIVVAIVTVILCRNRNLAERNRRLANMYKHSPQKGLGPKSQGPPSKGEGQPPDLWMHDNLELKHLGKDERAESSLSMSSTRRNSHDSSSIHTNNQAEIYQSGSEAEERLLPPPSYHQLNMPQQRNIIRPKPLKIPVESQLHQREPVATVSAYPNGHLMQKYSSPPNCPPSPTEESGVVPMRPVYPRTQYQMQYAAQGPPRVNAGDIANSTMHAGGYPMEYGYRLVSCIEEEDRCHPDALALDESYMNRVGYGGFTTPSHHGSLTRRVKSRRSPITGIASPVVPVAPNTEGARCPNLSQSMSSLGRPVNPLRSFRAPEPPSSCQHAISPTTPKHIVKPQQAAPPYKKPICSGPIKPRAMIPAPVVSPKSAPDVLKTSKDEAEIQKSLSTEELSAEMANLEGLMKDLNAITQQDFEC